MGVPVRSSGICCQPNHVVDADCVACGESFDHTKEEDTIDFLEQTHQHGENYNQRLRGPNAFQAGMLSGSFVPEPRECRRLPPVTATDTRKTPMIISNSQYPQEFSQCKMTTNLADSRNNLNTLN